MSPERLNRVQQQIEQTRLHVLAVRGWIADVRQVLHHHEPRRTGYIALTTAAEENAKLTAQERLAFGYIEVNYNELDDFKEAA